MGRHYIRNAGANPPGNPGKPVIGMAMTERRADGRTSLYLLQGFKGTRNTYIALKGWEGSRGRSFTHYKTEQALAEAIATHGIAGTIHNDGSSIWLES